jgi:hypothetical protein
MGSVTETDSRGPSLNARRRRLRQAPLEKRQTTRFLCSYTFNNWQGLGRRTQSGYKTSSTRLWWAKQLSHVLSSHDFLCVDCCFSYPQRNPVFMWSMRYMLQRQDGPSGAEPCHRAGWGSQNARYFRCFSLAAKKTVFICLLSAGELHSTVVKRKRSYI